jgi:hypothetical protein
MLQVVPKWKVTVKFPDREVEVWMYEQHLSNVLRTVASMQFSENGLEHPIAMGFQLV